MFFSWIVRLLEEFWPLFVSGTITTIEITFFGTVMGYLIGFLMGIIDSTPLEKEDYSIKGIFLRILKGISKLYVLLFRGTPMIVQAMVIYYGSLQVFGIDLNSFVAAVLVVSLNTGAYMAETVRGGICSIDPGQLEGAKALGMSHVVTMLTVILPQAFRNILPQMGNNFIANIKDTSVLNIISVSELFFTTKTVAGSYYKYFEAYTITAVIYLILTVLFNFLFALIEKWCAPNKEYALIDVEEYERGLSK